MNPAYFNREFAPEFRLGTSGRESSNRSPAGTAAATRTVNRMTSKGGGKGVGVSLLAQFSFAPRSSKFEDSDSSPEPPAEAVPGPDRRSPGPERSPKRARAGLAVTSTSSNAFAGVTPCSTALAAGVPTAVQREEGQVDAGNGDNAHPSSPSLTAETPNPGTTTGRAAGGDTDADISAKMEPAASDLSRFFGARHGGGNAATVPPVKQEHGRRNPLPGSSAATPAPAADVAAAIACSRDPDTRRKLREYDLIRQWRVSNKQTVDDFHNFLCELRDVNGRCANCPTRHPAQRLADCGTVPPSSPPLR